MRSRLISLILAAALLAVPSGAVRAQAKTPQTDDQKALYALGGFINKRMNLSIFNLTAEDMEWVKAGLADSVLTDKVTDAFLSETGPKIETLARTRMQAMAAKQKELSVGFLAKAAAEPGAKKLPSGMIFLELKAGTGASPKQSDAVMVNYRGTLMNGKVFDGSDEGKPSRINLEEVIPCWVDGLSLLKVGGKAKLTCPSDQAYGDMGSPPDIPAGAALVFEIELVSIEPPAAEKPAAAPTPPPSSP
ncbi:MAG: FKBP-type peptidyl-prolyl cis-trans isomerase [Acidobacteriota bacterium]